MKQKSSITEKIVRSAGYQKFEAITKKLILPGFDGLPLYDVVVFFIKGLLNGAITTRASSIAFKFFLSLFPAILFVFTLIPYIPIDNFQNALLEQLQSVVPENFYILLQTTITDIISRHNGGLLSFGIIMALYFASNGFLGVIVAFNNTFHSIETRNIIQQYLISIILMVIITLLLITATALIMLGTWFIKFLLAENILDQSFVLFILKAIKWLVVLMLLFFAISFMYYLAPAKKQRFRFISAGSTLATLLFIFTTLGFNYYVNNFASYNALYGSIGTIIIIMMWFYLNSISLLVGFELNASIVSARNKRTG